MMRAFLDASFLLQTDTAKELFRKHAEKLPIIDYQSRLDPKMIARNYQFSDLTEIWLSKAPDKWRAMRSNGISEEYITGNKASYEKFEKWAETLPCSMRHPLYHWTQMELSRIFGIQETLKPSNARDIYEECTAKLQTPEFRPQAIMRRMRVELVVTADDPADTLEYHREIRESDFPVKVLPAWNTDKVLSIDDPQAYNTYLDKLAAVADIEIATYRDLRDALQRRHDFFKREGCVQSDYRLKTFYAEPYTESQIDTLFTKLRNGESLGEDDSKRFRSALLYDLSMMDSLSGWVQQFHIGAMRNNNARMFKKLGADAGFDSMGDEPVAIPMNRFFSRLDEEGHLAKTIVSNLNPRDNDLFVNTISNFNDGSVPGKMQYGAARWLLNHYKGIEDQLNSLSSFGLLSHFIGVSTDSSSFLSYPRYEYFRRILCNMIGNEIEQGLLPVSEMTFINQMVENICYYNAKRYFGW